jgi:hypothetical protein
MIDCCSISPLKITATHQKQRSASMSMTILFILWNIKEIESFLSILLTNAFPVVDIWQFPILAISTSKANIYIAKTKANQRSFISLTNGFPFFVPPIQENARPEIITLDNWFGMNETLESDITCWNARRPCLYDDNQLDFDGSSRNYHSLKLPHISFTTPEQTIARIQTLINFA